TRQHDVEDRHVVAELRRRPETVDAVVKDVDDKALADQPASHGLRETLLVLHNQHPHGFYCAARFGPFQPLVISGRCSQFGHSRHWPQWNVDGQRVEHTTTGSSAMLRPTAPHLRRLDIRPGHWGQWLATGAAGLVGFVVLALLLIFQTGTGELDQRLLATVISVRSPDLTAFASAVTRLGSWSAVVCLGLAAALVLGLRSRRVLLP